MSTPTPRAVATYDQAAALLAQLVTSARQHVEGGRCTTTPALTWCPGAPVLHYLEDQSQAGLAIVAAIAIAQLAATPAAEHPTGRTHP
jgi:hypothetical protein